jgi:hypothetical protein
VYDDEIVGDSSWMAASLLFAARTSPGVAIKPAHPGYPNHPRHVGS